MIAEHSSAAPRHNRHKSAQLRPLLLVGAGGTLGSAIRFLLIEAFPSADGFAWSLLLINSGGSFLLGVLVSFLARDNSQPKRNHSVRLFYGTGILGGFTSYSALAAATGTTLMNETITAGVLYGVGTVILGVLGAGLGLSVGKHSTWKRKAK